ncbi:MAG: hypothetical protein VB082_10665 [Christensenella sp.]|nr:hypothetical protein [Christensenella sp.]
MRILKRKRIVRAVRGALLGALAVVFCFCLPAIYSLSVNFLLDFSMKQTAFLGGEEAIEFGVYYPFWNVANAKEGGSAYIDLRCTVRNDSDEDAAVTFAAADVKDYFSGFLKTPYLQAVDPQTGRRAVYTIGAGETASFTLRMQGAAGAGSNLKYDRKGLNFVKMTVWNSGELPAGEGVYP